MKTCVSKNRHCIDMNADRYSESKGVRAQSNNTK